MAMLPSFPIGLARHAWADEPVNAAAPAGPAAIATGDADDESFDPPAGRSLVFVRRRNSAGRGRARATAWSSRCGSRRTGSTATTASGIATTWPGGAKEFILVDAERGTRAAGLRPRRSSPRPSRRRPGPGLQGRSAPFDEIEFVDGAKAVRFRVGDVTWKCALDSYECSKAKRRRGGARRRRLPPPRRPPRGEDAAQGPARGIGSARRPRNGSVRPTASGRRSSRTTTSSSAPRGRPRTIRLSTTARRASRTAGSRGRPTRRRWSPSGSSRASARRST